MLENSIETSYTVHDFIRGRWSPFAFSNRLVEQEKLLILLEAARWAPSSYNQQPWSFILATKDYPNDYNRLLSCLASANQRWAQYAPVLMLSVAKLYFDSPAELNVDDTIESLTSVMQKSPARQRGSINRHAFYDVGMAVENLTLQAIALDLFVHQMAGFDIDAAKRLFHIPHDYEPVAAIAVGYLGNSHILPEELQLQQLEPRVRKPIEQFVFTERWGHSSLFANSA